MRIVHSLNHTFKANGHVAVAIDLACEQAKQHDVMMISAPGDFDDQLRAANVTVAHIGLRGVPWRVACMAAEMLPHLRRFRPNVVNAHMVTAALGAWLIQPLCGYKLVTTVHNSFDRRARLMGIGNRVIAVSEAVRDQMRKAGIADAKLHTVTNGTVGGARRPPLPVRTAKLERPAIVSVCGMHPRKGVNHLIAAFDEARTSCPSAHLYLIGEGPARPEYEAQARATASARHIHFLGYMEDPREVLAGADIFVLASLREPFGLVLAEARQMGNAIIATSVDGVPEALDGGRRGLLVPPADPEQLCDAIARLVNDPELRSSLSTVAREGLEEISVARMSSRTLRVYTEALGPSRAGQLAEAVV